MDPVFSRIGDETKNRVYKFFSLPKIEKGEPATKKEHDRRLEHIINLLTKGEIFFSDPRTVNDPFDSLIDHSFNGKEKQIEKWILGFLSHEMIDKNSFKAFSDLISLKPLNWAAIAASKIERLYLENRYVEFNFLPIKITCFADNWDCSPMWGHYASSHTGVCIGFETKNIITNGEGCLWLETIEHPLGSNIPMKPLMPLSYSNTRPEPFALFSETNDLQKKKRMTEFILSKHDAWKYEQERRLISVSSDPNNPPQEILHVKNHVVKEVIFGLRTDEKDKDTIINAITKDRHIALYKVKLPDSSFQFAREKIN